MGYPGNAIRRKKYPNGVTPQVASQNTGEGRIQQAQPRWGKWL
jgi:hypothetical protein